ncbi:MAG: hypothetical protein ACOCTI_01190 [Phycisphaeraceae bacterium]
MNRTRFACYCLLASAFVLGGLLVFQIGTHSRAEAEMLVASDDVLIMTAKIDVDSDGPEEGLFILEGSTGRLVLYTADLRDDQIEPAEAIDVNRLFAPAGAATPPMR